ncbi:hypothetical protein EDD86DRAFT_248875 [Gorgonomyces haynaldii]|nr:hypothetical protein EDD86DRAFT_248875 [Gorgonomyces haynaldii]
MFSISNLLNDDIKKEEKPKTGFKPPSGLKKTNNDRQEHLEMLNKQQQKKPKQSKSILFCEGTPASQVASWKPTLVIDKALGNERITLSVANHNPLRPGNLAFLLEPVYSVTKVLPRSYFSILQQNQIGWTFVFTMPESGSKFFTEIAGLRQTALMIVTETNSKDVNLFGFLVKQADVTAFIQKRVSDLLKTRRLPLVLDLDDTLVRAVGDEPGRYVPLHEIANRVRSLKDGRKVVLTERVHEFLEWAQKYFEISVCSLGEQTYVDMVISVLDPNRKWITGLSYSARGEYLYITQSGQPKRPPKDIKSLYAFCVIENVDIPVDPLIVDDNVYMWPRDQQDNVVKESNQSPVWNVSLFPVIQQVLGFVHEAYFKQLDTWVQSDPSTRGLPPCTLDFYKDYLRKELANKISAQ